VTAVAFDSHFDRFKHSAFRLEALPCYQVDQEDESFQAFRAGRALPERSVRTSPWLARMALTTLSGKSWRRVHVVDHPLSNYLQYELAAYLESAACGEMIAIADRSAHPGIRALTTDFWLFDAETEESYALLMNYAPDGRWLGFDHTVDPGVLARCRAERDLALAHSTALNSYLAGKVTIDG
jgi:hypothetical protein